MKELDMKKINKTMQYLKKNNMQAYYCDTKEEVIDIVKTLINENETIASGGSATLVETGVIDLLKNGPYNYLDRDNCENRDEVEAVMRAAYTADTYFMSSNAITIHGCLYNVDGNSNRVSALLYGPKSVIIVCGYNKIVDDLNEAVKRIRTVAAPKNTKRLDCDTYCKNSGECVAVGSEASYMCDGCRSNSRICCNYVVSAQQRHVDRIKVILVGEQLGF